MAWHIKGRRGQEREEQAADAAEAHRVLTLADISGLSAKDHHTDLKVDIHQSLLDRINLAALETMTRDQIHREIGELVHEQLSNRKHALNSRSEEHTYELQSLMRISYAVFCLKKKIK